MNKVLITAALIVAAQCSIANATLESRLHGSAYYDTELNITWTANANINGAHNWQDQMQWASNLQIESVSDWRLPELGEMLYLGSVESINIDNPLPFINLMQWNYWSNHEFDSLLAYASNFRVNEDLVFIPQFKYQSGYAMAVHQGDVLTAVPEPSTYAMLLAGLGLIGFYLPKK